MSQPASPPDPQLTRLLADIDRGGLAAELFDDPSRIVAVLDAGARVLRANATAGRWLGVDPAALAGLPVWHVPGFDSGRGLATPDERRERWQARQARLAEGDEEAARYEIELQPVEGEQMVLRVRPRAVTGADGRMAGILLMADDIGAERRAVRDAEAGARVFRALVESLPQMVWTTSDPGDGGPDYFAPGWERFLGVPAGQLIGSGWLPFVHPDDREQLLTAWQVDQLLDPPPPRLFRMRRADGEYRWMESQVRVVRDEDGNAVRTVGATLDITDRHREAERVRQQREQLRALLQLSRMGSYVWWLREDRFEGDGRCAEIMGLTPEEAADPSKISGFMDRVHPDDRAGFAERIAEARGSFDGRFEAEYRVFVPSPAGGEPSLRWIGSTGRIEFDEHGPMRMVGVISDITGRKEEEQARLRLQRVEALGTLAGGIAHDLRNVAGAILSYARVAQAELAAGASPAESLDEIARGALHAGEIVERLLNFGRSDGAAEGGGRSERFAPADVAREVESLLRPALPGKVGLRVEVADELPELQGDPTQLHQALINLVTNASHAIGASTGSIVIALEPATTSGGRPAVRIRVDDSGPGIPDAVMPRLFEPFFTTKPKGEGTGLGLPAVQHIVHTHGGTIEAGNRPEGGARFEIVLPAAARPAEAGATPEPESAPSAGVGPAAGPPGHQVLFVDDEPALVRAAQRAMPYRGFTVHGFTDPLRALAAFTADPDRFDVLVTDLSMPGITGLQLIERVRELRPDLPVVLTSGFIGPGDIEGHDVDAVMPKPVSIDDLAAAAARLIG